MIMPSLVIFAVIVVSLIIDHAGMNWSYTVKNINEGPKTSNLFYATSSGMVIVIVLSVGLMHEIDVNIDNKNYKYCYVVGSIFSTFGSYYSIMLLPHI